MTVATPEEPYLCMQVDIDPRQLSYLITETVRTEVHSAPTERGLFIGNTNDQLTDALLRLARLLDTPQDIPLLAPMVIREIYNRLLNGLYGRRIAQIAIKGTNMQRFAHFIQMLKAKFSKPIRNDYTPLQSWATVGSWPANIPGESTCRGGITKTGNAHLRRVVMPVRE